MDAFAPPAAPALCGADGGTPNPTWWIGVLLDCVATLAGTGGKQLLRFAVIKKNKMYVPLGLLGTAVIDPMFDISAYSFAAQSIIAPMAGMVVVWNIMLAPITLGEHSASQRRPDQAHAKLRLPECA